MIWIYRFLVAPIFLLTLPILALINEKVRLGLKLRMQSGKKDPHSREGSKLPLNILSQIENKPPIWIHASSGEFEYAKPVLRELKAKNPDIPILVTYFSPTFCKSILNNPDVDLAIPLPLDFPGPVNSFLNKFKPRICLLARTDFWPELLYQLRSRKIPRLVFSYTQKNVGQLGFVKKALLRWNLNSLTRIDCVSSEDAQELKKLGIKIPVTISGDTRYDQVHYRLLKISDRVDRLKSHLWESPHAPCFVAGSTWEEDEAVLLPALYNLLNQKKILLILVPHEPHAEHIEKLKNQFTEHSVSYSLFSKGVWDSSVLIVDQVGVLAELYTLGDFAFVGGSFKRSVHSVMEALGAGLRTFVGPMHFNNREALEFKKLRFEGGAQFVRPGVEEIASASDLEHALIQDLKYLDALKVFKIRLKQEFERRTGATHQLLETQFPVLAGDGPNTSPLTS